MRQTAFERGYWEGKAGHRRANPHDPDRRPDDWWLWEEGYDSGASARQESLEAEYYQHVQVEE